MRKGVGPHNFRWYQGSRPVAWWGRETKTGLFVWSLVLQVKSVFNCRIVLTTQIMAYINYLWGELRDPVFQLVKWCGSIVSNISFTIQSWKWKLRKEKLVVLFVVRLHD
jgi:hypothetical protein